MNNLIAQNKLFDIFTRQALFIEQVKVNEALLFNDVLQAIEEVFRKNLNKISYENLGELSKAQVQNFIKALRASQTVIYSKYQRQLLARLQKFTEAVVNQNLIIGGSYLSAIETNKEDDEFFIVPIGLQRSRNLIQKEYDGGGSSPLYGLGVLAGAAMLGKLWTTVKNAPMPTGGALLLNYVNTTLASNMMRVSQAVMTGWVNKLSVAEVAAQVLGSKSTGEGNPNLPGGSKSSEVTKIRNTMNAVTATIVQHTSQVSVAAVNSIVFKGYEWLAVMDSRTSAICKYLNRKWFRYGEGPLPPAHPNCRSHTMPRIGAESDFTPPELIAWLIRQSRGFIVGTFSNRIASTLAEGNRPPGDENVVNSVRPITVDEFANKTDDLFQSGDAGK